MNTAQFPSDGLQIPQYILDQYNACYNNATYRAFSEALANTLPSGDADQRHVLLTNLLIDSSFERLGATLYNGACAKLGAALVELHNPELYALAERHLSNFNHEAEETVLTAGLLHTLETLCKLADQAARAASTHHGWRGRTVFWWLVAIALIAQATHAILSEAHSSYVQEKFTYGIRNLRDGVSEASSGGFIFTHAVMNWFTRFPER